ncbi:MAG TPA: hypothetical protein VKU41_14950 [Polyangiaceae bacterium]|nr:hypothetical protein [Polyangiaceae bacterium]
MRNARKRAEFADRDELVDSEVPAAVVCAHCGDADCPGCLHEQTRSGVVAVVAWERPGASAWSRLWATARASTFDAERFFESLPDGPVAPALRFAVVCELMASTAVALTALVPLCVVAPGWVKHLLLDAGGAVARLAAAGIPAVAGLLVVAHAAHGWALDLGARRSGAPAATTRALRFGLYAAGWDLVVGPLGALVVGVKQGLRAAWTIVGLGIGLPTRSARAFVRGCYRLDGKGAEGALRASYVAAILATAVGAAGAIAAAAYLLLL